MAGVNYIEILRLNTEDAIVVYLDYGNLATSKREELQKKTLADVKEVFPNNRVLVVGK
jgi:tRNA G10  N-methylase Trm11